MIRSFKITKSTIVGILLFLCYFGFWWLYKLDVLPGLHGDEAWFGLKAHQFNVSGIHHLYGMNTYTGILQPLLSSYSFKIAGLGVYQLRMPGVFFNLMALVIIVATFLVHKKSRTLILFLLILSQSALYLIAPRVAWEVNTFTLFFLSLLIASALNLISDANIFKPFWSGVFLIANILGTYNHIMFSCISVSALIGVALWSLYNNTLRMKNIILLLIFNLINVTLVFVTMRYWLDAPLLKKYYFIAALIPVLLILETILLKKLSKVTLPKRFTFHINVNFIYAILIALVISFIIFHGMALYQLMSDYKLIIRAYSYQFSPATKLLFLIGGGVICFYLCFFLLEDIKNKEASLFAIFIITYLGLLAIYTTQCSFRYYLSIYPIISIYLAFKMSKQIKRTVPLIISFVGIFLMVNSSLYKIFSNPGRPLQAIGIIIGNNEIETSAHFLPDKPLIDFLKENKISRIDYLSSRYFLEQPILFYRLVTPWQQLPGNTAIIGYDYSKNDHGGFLLFGKNIEEPPN